LTTTIHFQSIEARHRIINQFCKLIATSAIASTLLYVYLQIHVLAAATVMVAGLFLFFVYLNKRGNFKISRAAIVITTNLGITFFSFYLGFESGIYFYLFVAPLLLYLLFDFSEKRSILFFLFMYIATFILIHTDQNPFSAFTANADPSHLRFIYSFNFCVTLALCFGLVTYFAGNNKKYILSLTDHQELLVKEIELRTKNEELVKKSLHEREILLAEIHHRVRNNLAIISGLINIQADNLKEEKSKEIFEETKNRIYAMALIHTLLYQNKSFADIDFSQYVEMFCANIQKSYERQPEITIENSIEKVAFDINTAIPLAMIINELVTNAYKHAFKDQHQGKITIQLRATGKDQYEMCVSDNGAGMDRDLHQLTDHGIGLDIVRSLTDQIDGKMRYVNEKGSRFTIVFPLPEQSKKALTQAHDHN
jgi:two-component sensor histidine kinase